MLDLMAVDDETLRDGWLTATRYVLIFTGVCYLPLMGMGPFMASSRFNDPHMSAELNRGFGLVFTLAMVVICGGVAAVNFAAAWGLARGKKWAWIVGVILGGLYAPSICFPLGGVILYGLLRENVRRPFMDGSAPALPR